MLPPWARRKHNLAVVMRELRAALIPSVHEGLVPTYGAIVLPEGSEPTALLPLAVEELVLARKAADGSSALVAWEGPKLRGLSLLGPSATPDLQLAQIVRSKKAIIIRRQRGGLVSLYAPDHNLTHVERQWAVSPAINLALSKILQVAPMAEPKVLAQILEFAFYVLSPWRIGATLVWLLSEKEWGDTKVNLLPLDLSVSPKPDKPSLGFTAHFLGQHDGATIIASEGTFSTTGIHLTPTAEAEKLIPIFRGTRHTSARRASYDRPDILIITVSADGPVTVFSDGVNIFEMWWYSAEREAKGVEKILGRSGDDSVFASEYETDCSNCGKTSRVETLKIAGWTDHEEADCPVCGVKIAEDMCWRIHANLVKVF